MGFTRSKASTCCYQHATRDLRCIVHEDDFVFVGAEHELRWVQGRMEESFLVKVIGQLGGDPSDLKELRVLNKVLRWTADGILLEADPRHQEILVAAEPGNAPHARHQGSADRRARRDASERRGHDLVPVRGSALQLFGIG